MAFRRREKSEAEPSGGILAAASTIAAGLAIIVGFFICGVVILSLDSETSDIAASAEPLTIVDSPSAPVSLAVDVVDAPSEPAFQPAFKPLSGIRTWTDNSGKHRAEGQLVDIAGSVAYLHCEGKIKAVPFNRLSAADLAFIRQTHSIQILDGKVVGIADGDTFTLLDASKTQHKIRVEGIDAPESTQDYGTKSRQALADRIFQKTVRVEWREKDKYGRTLGHVFVDGQWVNKGLLSDGWAWHYKEYNQSAILAEAEAEARAAKVGLWAGNSPVAPWTFRHSPTAIRGPPTVAGAPANASETVYATRTGAKYHREGCRYLSKSSIPISLGDVLSRYTPCSVCNPPALEQSAAARQIHEQPSTTSSGPTVYATRSGGKYHEAGCRYLRTSSIPMSLSEAAMRYSPCSVCNPPRATEAKNESAESSYTPRPYSAPTYSPPTNSGGTVQVRGYYRKDGTYVRPHTRRAPRR